MKSEECGTARLRHTLTFQLSLAKKIQMAASLNKMKKYFINILFWVEYPFKGQLTRSNYKDPILGSKNWKQAFRRSHFKVPFLW